MSALSETFPELAAPVASAAASPARRVFARVAVFSDPAEALALWRDLDPELCASFYQSENFVLRWLEYCGRRRGAAPFFIAAYDASGAGVALLPLALFRFGPLRVAQFIGGGHANYNLGLFRSPAEFSTAELRRLLREAARQAPEGPHLYRLLNLPLAWRGAANPLCQLPHRPSADRAYAAALMDDGEAFLAAHLSGEQRKKWRKKAKRLAHMWAVQFLRAETPELAKRVLDAYFEQKSQTLPGFAQASRADGTRAFHEALAASGALELYAMMLDGRIVATFGAGLCGGRLQGLINSYDGDPDIARSSPGNLLIAHVVRDACARKHTAFDLGLGDAPYKTTFCNEIEPMANVILATGVAGALARPLFEAASTLKAMLKRRKRLIGVLGELQRRLKGFGY